MGRKVVELLRKLFRNWHDKKITLMLISTGCLSILAGFSTPVWLTPLIYFLNEILNINIPIPDSNVDYIVMFTAVFVGILLIYLGINYIHRNKIQKNKKKMIQIRHSSIEAVDYSNIRADLEDYDVIPIYIDQYQDLNKIHEFNLKMAWRKQEQAISKLHIYINEFSTKEIAYLGMAHIPFQFLLGYQVADKIRVQFFEWNRTDKFWMQISKEENNYPELILQRDESKQDPNEVEEIVIKVGISFEIFEWQLEGHNLENLNSFYFKLEPPRLDAITSLGQINTYKKKFRDLLTEIHHKYQKVKKVHIYMSAPPSVVFSFGSSISARMDSNKEFWIYNYVGSTSSNIFYPWGIKISKDLEQGEIKIL